MLLLLCLLRPFVFWPSFHTRPKNTFVFENTKFTFFAFNSPGPMEQRSRFSPYFYYYKALECSHPRNLVYIFVAKSCFLLSAVILRAACSICSVLWHKPLYLFFPFFRFLQSTCQSTMHKSKFCFTLVLAAKLAMYDAKSSAAKKRVWFC